MAADEASFDDFVAARSAALVRSAYLLCGDRARAEDLVQNALTKTWLRWDRIGEMQFAEAYVRRILFSGYVAWWRRARRESVVRDVPDRAGRDEARAVDDRNDVLAALARLPKGQRAVVVLRFYEDLTEAQTAEALGCAIGTVKSQTARALARLRADRALALTVGEARSTDTDLRDALARAAGGAGAAPLRGAAIRLRARRRRRTGVALTVAAVTAVVLVVAALPGALLGGRDGAVADYAAGAPVGGGYLRWPVRGDLAGRTDYAVAAREAWDASPLATGRGPHTDVRVLYAATGSRGPLVALTGLDRDRERRVAVLRGMPYEREFSGAMVLEYDRAAPPPEDTRALVLWRRVLLQPAEGPLVVIAEPGLAVAEYRDVEGAPARPLPLTNGAGAVMAGFAVHEVSGYAADGSRRFRVRVTERGERRAARPRMEPPERPPLTPPAYARPDPSWRRPGHGLGPAEQKWRTAIEFTTFARNDAVAEHLRVASPVWSGRLPDGTQVYVEVVPVAGRERLVVAAYAGGSVDFYVDRPLDGGIDALPGVAVAVRGARSWWLLAVANPRTASATYHPDGGAAVPLPLRGGVAYRRLAGDGPRHSDRVAWGTAEPVPLDAAQPLAPVR